MYDARSRTGDTSNMLFGLVTIAVVGFAFAGTWFLSGHSGNETTSAPLAETTSSEVLAAVFDTPNEAQFLASLQALDRDAPGRLEAGLAVELSASQEIELVGRVTGEAIMANLEHLPHFSDRDINRLITLSSTELRKAQTSNSVLCKGATWASLENKSEAQVRRWFEGQGFDERTLYQQSLPFQAEFLDMLVRAKRSPSRHGQLNSRDEAAFQDLMMGLMTDPQIMGLMAAGNNKQAAMRNLDVCAVGVSLLDAVNRLPDATKGRAWSTALSMAEFDQVMDQARDFGF